MAACVIIGAKMASADHSETHPVVAAAPEPTVDILAPALSTSPLPTWTTQAALTKTKSPARSKPAVRSATAARATTPTRRSAINAPPQSTAARITTHTTSTSAEPPPQRGPHLVRGYLVSGWAACKVESDYVGVNYWVHYGSLLDVYGPTAHHRWLMEVPGYGSVGPDATRPIPNGVEFVFGKAQGDGENPFAEELYQPDYRPIVIYAQNVIDASAGKYTYTRLPYENGDLELTTANCTT